MSLTSPATSRNTPPMELLAIAALAIDRSTRHMSIVRERHENYSIGWMLRIELNNGRWLFMLASPETMTMQVFLNRKTIEIADITEAASRGVFLCVAGPVSVCGE